MKSLIDYFKSWFNKPTSTQSEPKKYTPLCPVRGEGDLWDEAEKGWQDFIDMVEAYKPKFSKEADPERLDMTRWIYLRGFGLGCKCIAEKWQASLDKEE